MFDFYVKLSYLIYEAIVFICGIIEVIYVNFSL